MRILGWTLIIVAIVGAAGAPVLAPHAVDDQFRGLLNAAPTILHVVDDSGRWHRPFIYPWRLVSQLEQRYQQDRSTPVPLVWFTRGRLVGSADDSRAPLMLLGADSFGRDVFSRLLFGARISLALSIAAALGSMLIGGLIGGVAGVFLAGGVLSLASIVGFITLFGIATRNGIMLISHVRDLRDQGTSDFRQAVVNGASERLAPILMTALAAGLALVPIAMGMGKPGSEIQAPMAIVIFCGLLTSTALNMIVVPAAYYRFRGSVED